MAVAEREIAVPPASSDQEPRPFRWTREQYHQIGDMGWFQDRRVELIDGEIIEMPPIGSRHWTSVLLVAKALRGIFSDGYFVTEQTSFNALGRSEPEPDAAVYEGQIRDFVNALPTDPRLVVEVSDTTLSFDRTRKATLYARAGVEDYWIVNLESRQLEVHRLPGDLPGGLFGYADVTVHKDGEAVAPLAAPDSPIAVADLLP